MGFYIRKSLNIGLGRLNISSSGLGISFGVKGARVSVGPRGTTVHAGRGGFYFRQNLSGGNVAPRSGAKPGELTGAQLTPIGDNEILIGGEDPFLYALRECSERWRIMPFVILSTILGDAAICYLLLPIHPIYWSFVAVLTGIGIAGAIFARRFDEDRLTLNIDYAMDGTASSVYKQLLLALDSLGTCSRLWQVSAEGNISDWKRNAGAKRLARRMTAGLRPMLPPRLKTKVRVMGLVVSRRRLFFLPDRLLVYEGSRIHSFGYGDLAPSGRPTRFIDDTAPPDSKVVEYTWQYVNKSGGPDKRFNNNRRLPVCEYGELRLEGTRGLEVVIQSSATDPVVSVASAIMAMSAMKPRPFSDEGAPFDTTGGVPLTPSH